MKEKLRWWRRFWPPTIIVCSVLIIAQCILYVLGYIDLSELCGGILIVFVAIPLTYGIWYLRTRYETSKKIQLFYKIAFIGLGGVVAWVITFFGTALIILAVKGMPKPSDPSSKYPEISLFFLFVVPWVVGGFIGYWLGKRRDFRPFT